MAKRRVLIVEDEVLIALELAAIVRKALDAEVLLSVSVAGAKKLIDPPVDLALGSRREQIPDNLRDAPFIPKPCSEQKLVEQIRKVVPDLRE
jgi:hypothetical protein